MPSRRLPSALLSTSLCVLLLLLCVALTLPAPAMGVNDEFSYVWSARIMADTGHIVYNGWGAMMLGWQLYLGALFIKLFGFSIDSLRCSILLVSVFHIVLIQRLLLRLGISEWNATFATLMIVLSPLSLPLTFSYMSDIPGFFVLVLALYCCVRAVQADSDKGAILWLVIAAVSNLIGGTVRQTAWLGALIVLPSAAWYMRRRRSVFVTGLALWVVSALAIVVMLRWFKAQPYSIPEPLLMSVPMTNYSAQKLGFLRYTIGLSMIIRSAVEVFLFPLPVLVAFVAHSPRGTERLRNLLVIAALPATALFYLLGKKQRFWTAIPFTGNYVTRQGLDWGSAGKPLDVIPIWICVVLTVAIFAAIFCTFLWVWRRFKDRGVPSEFEPETSTISTKALLTLFAPLCFVYIALFLTRPHGAYDRYLLPPIFFASVFALRVYQTKGSGRLPALSVIFLAIFTAYAVASTHDLFANYRARLLAADELQRAGVKRTEFRAGFDYDGWTQLEQTGYVNNEKLVNPPDAYHPTPAAHKDDRCKMFFLDESPSIHAKYALAHNGNGCFGPSSFPSVPYTAWVPPYKRAVDIDIIPPDSIDAQ